MKYCPNCKQTKSFSEFWKHKNRTDGLSSWCSACDKDLQVKKRAYGRSVLTRYKLMKGCAKCGYKEHPAALEFNHINPELKKFNIASRAIAISSDVFRQELAKCEILCANCHRIHTYGKEEAHAA